ncbi:hypothetical protein [Pseudomonas sp.]|uniref:hypothetical protein n=1 Tax=Pseudomonas sp. TaxID=306 RepID=UPI00263998C8|nr:hypothetical protein [Pseudomonas sp.]
MNQQHEVLNSRNSLSQARAPSGVDRIEVKKAVQVTKAAANDFLGQEVALQDLLVEEAELSPDNKT